MKFVNSSDVNADGTGFKGYVRTTYSNLVAQFGEPTYRNGDKVTCEWTLKFEDGTIATIYDYRECETPLDEYNWNIGGYTYEAVMRVTERFPDPDCF